MDITKKLNRFFVQGIKPDFEVVRCLARAIPMNRQVTREGPDCLSMGPEAYDVQPGDSWYTQWC